MHLGPAAVAWNHDLAERGPEVCAPEPMDAEATKKGGELVGEAEGNPVLTRSWPGQIRGCWGDPERFS